MTVIPLEPSIAPDGQIWVCMSCMRKTKYVADFAGTHCFNDAVLCDEVQPAPGFYAVSEPAR